MYLTVIYRIFHPTAAEYTLFSAGHGMFSKICNILGHKASLKNTRKMGITCILLE
jgi:hypothetical protein